MTRQRVLIGYWLLFGLVLSLGQIVRWQLAPNVMLFPIEVMMGGWLLGVEYFVPGTLHACYQRLRHWWFPIVMVASWIAIGWGNAAFTGTLTLRPMLYALRALLYLGFGISVWVAAQRSNVVRLQVPRAMMLTTLLWWWFGILQYFLWPDTRVLFFLGWDDHYYRLISTILDPGFMGVLFVGALGIWLTAAQTPIWQKLFAPTQQQLRWPILLSVASGFFVAILLTYSRASYLALLAFMAVGLLNFWRQERIRTALFVATALFVIALPLLPRPDGEGVKLERTASAVSRTAGWQLELSTWRGWQMVIGRGVFVPAMPPKGNEYESPAHGQTTESWPVFLLTQLGIPGCIVGVGILAWGWWQLRRWGWFQAAFTGLLVHGLFNASLTYPLVWLVIIGSAVTALQASSSHTPIRGR